jgi:ABC-type sugar transport system substrate-binding protein
MYRIKKAAALFFSAALLGALAAAPAAQADSQHKCSPGQHGNKHPGFKPGSC